MKRWMILSLSLAISSAFGQELTRKVTFSAPAGTAKVVLAEFSKVAGVVLRSGSLTHNEVILLDVHDVPLSDVMKRIAIVTGAEWEEGTGIYTLVRSTRLDREQEGIYRAARAAALKTSLDAALEEIVKSPELDAAAIKAQEEKNKQARQGFEAQLQGAGAGGAPITLSMPRGGSSPTKRALLRIAQNIDLDRLAAMTPSSRMVFAINPNRAQVALPDSAKKAVLKFVDEQNLWVKTVGKPTEAPGSGGTFTIRAFGGGTELFGNEQPASQITSIARTLVVANRYGSGDTVGLEFKAFDAEGKMVGRASLSLNGRISAEDKTVDAKAKTLELDEESKAFAKSLASDSGAASRQSFTGGSFEVRLTVVSGVPMATSSARVALPAALREKALKPDVFDPLSFVATPLFTGAAKLDDLNLVACIPDEALMPLARKVSAGPIQDTQLFSIGIKEAGMNIEKKDGWLVVQPRFHWLMRENRVDRVALAKFLGSVDRAGTMGLSALSTYASSRATPVSGPGLDDLFLGLINGDAQNDYRFEAMANWRMLRMFASFSREQRMMLDSRRGLSLQGLSKSQFDLLNSMVFNDMNGPQVQTRTPNRGGEAQLPMPFRNEDILMGERTEALPSGALAAGQVNLRLNPRDGVIGTAIGEGGTRFFTPEDYGSHLAMMDNPAMSQGMTRTNYDGFRPARTSTLDFSFVLAPQVSMQRTLKDFEVQETAKPVSYERLPEDFKSRAKRAMEATKSALEKGAAFPPPPPVGGRIPPTNRN